MDAVRAWSTFVEHGDDAEDLVRPEILTSWNRSEAAISTDVARRCWPTSPRPRSSGAARRCRCRGTGRGRAPPYRRGRRLPSRSPSPIPGSSARTAAGRCAAGRDRELRAGRALGRRERRHERARPRDRLDASSMVFSAEHYASIVHNWGCRAAPVHDPITGAQLGVIDLSTTWDRTDPIGLATARVMARRSRPRCRPPATGRDPPTSPPSPTWRCGCSAPPRPGSTGSGCCSTAVRPRCSRCSPCTPRGCPWSSCTRWSTATSRSRSRRSRPRSRTCARRSAASSARAPTG